jgi:hypothetical protein
MQVSPHIAGNSSLTPGPPPPGRIMMCRRHAVDSDSDIAGTASVTVAGGLVTSHGSSFKFRLGVRVTPHTVTGRGSLALRLSGAAALSRRQSHFITESTQYTAESPCRLAPWPHWRHNYKFQIH